MTHIDIDWQVYLSLHIAASWGLVPGELILQYHGFARRSLNRSNICELRLLKGLKIWGLLLRRIVFKKNILFFPLYELCSKRISSFSMLLNLSKRAEASSDVPYLQPLRSLRSSQFLSTAPYSLPRATSS